MNRKVSILWIIIPLLIIVLSSFGVYDAYKAIKDDLNASIDENKQLIEQSKKIEDSLIKQAENERYYSDLLREENDKLQKRNNSLYYQLKRRNAQVFVIDTAFISNARRISESSSRFYKRNDTIR